MSNELQPRYAAFRRAHGQLPNWQYMDFIAAMKRLYLASKGVSGSFPHISDHDDFTAFIEVNAAAWEPDIQRRLVA